MLGTVFVNLVSLVFLLGLLGIGAVATLKNYWTRCGGSEHSPRCGCRRCSDERWALRDTPTPPYQDPAPFTHDRKAFARWQRYEDERQRLIARKQARGLAWGLLSPDGTAPRPDRRKPYRKMADAVTNAAESAAPYVVGFLSLFEDTPAKRRARRRRR